MKLFNKLFKRKRIDNECIIEHPSIPISEERKKQFTGVWDARRLLYELLSIAKSVKNGKIELYATESTDDSYKIRSKRVVSVINAFRGRKIIFANSDSILLSTLVSEGYSEENISELIALIEDVSPVLYKECIGNAFSQDNIYSSREQLFSILFEYRLETYKLATHWNGVLETDIAREIAIDITRKLYDEKIENVNETLDKLLLLLLGDDFNKTFTEKELLEDYDYPNVTDEELHEMELEYC